MVTKEDFRYCLINQWDLVIALISERDDALLKLKEAKEISERQIQARLEIEAKYMDKLNETK